MTGTPLVLDVTAKDDICALCALAEAHPVEVTGLEERLQNPEAKAAHMAQMTRQTIHIPLAFLVTFSIEHGHPCGTCRHLSMSVQREGRVPHPAAVWMIAQEFGFWGSFEQCNGLWHEELKGHGIAINIVQAVERNLTTDNADNMDKEKAPL